jgi:hypothetical protein
MDPTPDEIVADEEVTGSRPVACWSVREGDWCDELPAEVAALLAPPLIVSAETFVSAGRPPSTCEVSEPVVSEPVVSVSTVSEPAVGVSAVGTPAAYGPRHAAPDDEAARFVTPGLPRRLRHRRRPAHAA